MQPSMRTRLFPRVSGIALGALACGALLGVLGTSCQQPKTLCTTAHLYYAAKYELKSGDPMTCGRFKGDVLGMNTYFATGGLNGTPKFTEPSMAIRAQYAGLVFEHAQFYSDQNGEPVAVPGLEDDPKDPDDYDHMANALGDFDRAEPDDDDFCFAEKVGPARLELPELPEIPPIPEVVDDPMTPEDESAPEVPGIPATPATSIVYEWSDAKWLVSANYQGTQFEADLKFTEDGCTAEYHVVAVAPAIGCQSDDDCTTAGVGINPDFAVKCDLGFEDQYGNVDVADDPGTPEDETENWGLCVLSKDLPSLN